LAILCGRAARRFVVVANPLHEASPPAGPGLTRELLGRRAGRRRGRAECRRRQRPDRCAIADFIPLQPDEFRRLREPPTSPHLNWQSRNWAIAPSISFPIFEGGRLRGQSRGDRGPLPAGRRRLRESGSGRLWESRTPDRPARLSDEADPTRGGQRFPGVLRVAQVQYKQGLVDYLIVIDRRADAARQQLYWRKPSISSGRQHPSIKALGGGWNP